MQRLHGGQGMLEINRALGDLRGLPTPRESAADVSQAAHARDTLGQPKDSLACDAVLLFMKILGDVAGDLALAT
ncbi:glucokinase, partial [Cobetia marina]